MGNDLCSVKLASAGGTSNSEDVDGTETFVVLLSERASADSSDDVGDTARTDFSFRESGSDSSASDTSLSEVAGNKAGTDSSFFEVAGNTGSTDTGLDSSDEGTDGSTLGIVAAGLDVTGEDGGIVVSAHNGGTGLVFNGVKDGQVSLVTLLKVSSDETELSSVGSLDEFSDGTSEGILLLQGEGKSGSDFLGVLFELTDDESSVDLSLLLGISDSSQKTSSLRVDSVEDSLGLGLRLLLDLSKSEKLVGSLFSNILEDGLGVGESGGLSGIEVVLLLGSEGNEHGLDLVELILGGTEGHTNSSVDLLFSVSQFEEDSGKEVVQVTLINSVDISNNCSELEFDLVSLLLSKSLGIRDLLESNHEFFVEVTDHAGNRGEPSFVSLEGVEGLVGKSDVGNIALSEFVALTSEVGVANSELLFVSSVIAVEEEGGTTGNSGSLSRGHTRANSSSVDAATADTSTSKSALKSGTDSTSKSGSTDSGFVEAIGDISSLVSLGHTKAEVSGHTDTSLETSTVLDETGGEGRGSDTSALGIGDSSDKSSSEERFHLK